MKTRIVWCAVARLMLGAGTILHCQETAEENAKTDTAAVKPATACKPADSLNFWDKTHFTGGQITLPFKIRSDSQHHSFRLTTDVTLGGYIGITHLLSLKRNYHLTIPLTAGLTFININNNNTSLDRSLDEAEVIPGLSWSTGIILQLENYNLGLMIGKDYASDIGNQWQYHGKLWWSSGIGFSFLK